MCLNSVQRLLSGIFTGLNHKKMMRVIQRRSAQIIHLLYLVVQIFLTYKRRLNILHDTKRKFLSIENRGNGLYEISGMEKDLINQFSKRHENIEKTEEQLRDVLTFANDAQINRAATLESRPNKHYLSVETLKSDWNKQIQALGYSPEVNYYRLKAIASVSAASRLKFFYLEFSIFGLFALLLNVFHDYFISHIP